MKKIKDTVTKPSEALQAMIDGLLEQSKRSDFRLEMSNWGEYDSDNEICYGCAAFCTIQKVAGVFIHDDNANDLVTRAEVLGFNEDDLNDFENAINDSRCGFLGSLFEYFGLPKNDEYDDRFDINDRNWHSELEKVRETIHDLELAGF